MSDKVRFYLLLALFIASVALLVYAYTATNHVIVG